MHPAPFVIARLEESHWPAVREIYEQGLATGEASFETVAPSWDRWNAGHAADPRIVALDGDTVIGWAALSPVSARVVYAGVAEVSIYIRDSARGRGVGLQLLRRLIALSEANG